jgi:carbohydrate kinase (thermoresistant glucokinase family)
VDAVVVMGATGVGKTTVGRALADRLGAPFLDADDLHPAENVERMARGEPLTDDHRRPWLDAVGAWLAEHPGGVVACSALRRSYRDRLRAAAPEARFLHLVGDAELLGSRLQRRTDHFMPPALVASQLDTLEPLEPDEGGLELAATLPVQEILDAWLDVYEG